jgi:hypothetical protein
MGQTHGLSANGISSATFVGTPSIVDRIAYFMGQYLYAEMQDAPTVELVEMSDLPSVGPAILSDRPIYTHTAMSDDPYVVSSSMRARRNI